MYIEKNGITIYKKPLEISVIQISTELKLCILLRKNGMVVDTPQLLLILIHILLVFINKMH